MSYRAYRVVDLGLPRDHHAIFVELDLNGSGWVYQVTGNIQDGMTHDFKPAAKPEDSPMCLSKTLIGTVSATDLPRIKAVCESLPAPKKQFEGSRQLNLNEPIRRCQEWTADAIRALHDAKVVVES